MPPSRLAASFAQHRIPHISLAKVIQSSLRKGRAKITGTEHRYAPLVVELFYPPRGAGLTARRMADRITAASAENEICAGTQVTAIEARDGRIVAVRHRPVAPTAKDGQLCVLASGTEPERHLEPTGPEQRLECDRVASSVPLPALIDLLGEAVSAEAKAAAGYLRFRAITIVGLRVKRPLALPAQSIYFTNKTFNRLSETRNYGGSGICAPAESGLLLDITCDRRRR